MLTRRVKWEGEEAFLHLFTNVTSIQEEQHAKDRERFSKAMMSNVYHELRTPLNSIIGSNDLMGQFLN